MVRVKYRYFLVEIICEDYINRRHKVKLDFDKNAVGGQIDSHIRSFLGDYGSGHFFGGFSIKMFNPYSRIVCIRTKRRSHKLLTMILPYVRRISRTDCFLRTLHLAGSLRLARKFLQKFHYQHLALLLKNCNDETEREAVQNSIRSCLAEKVTDT